MTIDLDAIEAAARGATPGPWIRFENGGWHVAEICTVFGGERDAHYIATMDPQTTLALVERVRELESMCRCARVEMQHMLHCANTDSVPHDGDDFHELLGRMDTHFGD